MKVKTFAYILVGLAFYACTPANQSQQSNEEYSDSSSVFDTSRSESALDSTAVGTVQGSDEQSAPAAGHSRNGGSGELNSGGTRTNIGQDTAGEFQQKE